jgi:hypothetical protein
MTTAADPMSNYVFFLPPSGDPQMHSYYTFIALDLARERAAEASNERLAATGRDDGSKRRTLAIGLAAVGRLVGATVRRLDARVADDLAESLHPESLAATH